MQAVVALDRQGLLPQGLVARHAPQLGGDVVLVGQELAGLQGGLAGRPGEQDRRPPARPVGRRGEAVQAPQDARRPPPSGLGGIS